MSSSALLDLAVLIQDTQAEIAVAERALAESSGDLFAVLNAQTLQKRSADLQSRFEELAAQQAVEILRYRLLVQPVDATVRAVNEVLATFQQSFTVMYDAIATHSTKKVARVSEQSLRNSAFGFAYSFSGSLGFVLTLPRQMLFTDEQSTAIASMETISKIEDEAELRSFADEFGIGAVRTLYKWFDAIAKYGADSHVEWSGSRLRPPLSFLVQASDARAVRDIIARSSDEEHEIREWRGTLLGYDSEKRTFRFSLGDRLTIHGSVSERVTEPLKIPDQYEVRIRTTTIFRYSTEEKGLRYELVDVLPR